MAVLVPPVLGSGHTTPRARPLTCANTYCHGWGPPVASHLRDRPAGWEAVRTSSLHQFCLFSRPLVRALPS